MASTSSFRRYSCPRDKSQNMYHLLLDREYGIDRRYRLHKRSPTKFNIEFFKCIPPNLTISNVEKPPNFIRKFSPDGKYLICFSNDQQSFENYKFLGTANAGELLYNWKTEYIPYDAVKGHAKLIRQNIFDRLFQMKWSIQLTMFTRPLHREFSLFTEDGKYVIVATNIPVQEENIPSYYTLNSIRGVQFDYDLNSYRFFTVRLEDGVIWDSIEYTYDFINLSHNHGVCIAGNMIAVVSLFHQWINIVQLDDGKFIKLMTIGRHFHGSDDCLCCTVPEYKDNCIALAMKSDGLKQKVLTRIYKNILCAPPDQQQKFVQKFYRRFKVYQAMEIYKVQFIDSDHLLIRYDTNKQVMNQPSGLDLTKLYVAFSISKNAVIGVYNERDRQLFWLLTNYFDEFRQTRSAFTGRAPSSVSNNIYLKNSQRRLIESYFAGGLDAAYTLLPQLPISAQSFSVSPYLDLGLFRYDDHLISALERPRYSSCEPIRFSDRDTELTKFRIHSALPDQLAKKAFERNRLISKELVAYIFHPYEPFIISVQKLSTRYVTNFHIRNAGTIVKL